MRASAAAFVAIRARSSAGARNGLRRPAPVSARRRPHPEDRPEDRPRALHDPGARQRVPGLCQNGSVKTAAQILQSKPSQAVHAIMPGASVFDAVKLMADKGIGALLVMDGDAIAGIITERDYARKVILMGRSSKETPVTDIMTANVLYVSPDQTSEECMALMTENRVRHLPVLDSGKLVGLISIGDLVKDIISDQRFVIDQLEQYIRGDR